MVAVAVLAAIVGAGLAAYATYKVLAYVRSPLSKLPMPPTASMIGGHVGPLSDPRHHRTLLGWDRSVGPIYCLRAFWIRMVVVSDPALVHQLLRSERSTGVDKSLLTYNIVNPMSSDKGHPSLFSASTHSPYWKLVRKGTAPGGSFRHVQAVCDELLEQLHRIGPDAAFDVDNLLLRATLDIIGRVAFNTNFNSVQAFRGELLGEPRQGESAGGDIFTIIQHSLEELNRRWANPLRDRFMWWLPEVRRAERYWHALQAHMRELLKQVRSRGPPAEGDESIAAHLLRLKDPHTGQPLSDNRLLPEITTFFIAGMDTTAHTLAWTLYLLAQHPEAEARACAELEELGLLATPQHPHPRPVEHEDLSRLAYLGAVVKESMRMLPVSADGTAVTLPRDIELGGHTIPANCILWVHIFSTHNSGRYWERPDEFLPERFLQPGAEYAGKGPPDQQAAGGPDPFMPGSPAEAAAVSAGGAGPGPASPIRAGSGRAMGLGDASRPLRFFPFSQGARDCIGQALARMDYLAMLAALLGRYNFRLTPEAAQPGAIRDIIALTLQPEGGLPVFAVPRAPGDR